MQLHYDQEWDGYCQWWVTWNNHSLFRSQAIIKKHMILMHDINLWFDSTKIPHIAESEMRGRAGYGFKTRNDALLFFLRWQDASIGVLE